MLLLYKKIKIYFIVRSMHVIVCALRGCINEPFDYFFLSQCEIND